MIICEKEKMFDFYIKRNMILIRILFAFFILKMSNIGNEEL